MDHLSPRQKKILSFIQSFIAVHGYPPTIREIGNEVGIASTSVVNYNLNKLVERGFIERSPDVSRGLRLVSESASEMPIRYAEPLSLVHVPLLGSIVASAPVPIPGDGFTPQEADDQVELPQAMLGKFRSDELFALRVNGDSMVDAMVADGDVVVLKRQDTARNGDMVAVWLSERGETTLKKYYLEGKRIRLQPANPLMDPIYVDAEKVSVQGRVLAVLRTLQ